MKSPFDITSDIDRTLTDVPASCSSGKNLLLLLSLRPKKRFFLGCSGSVHRVTSFRQKVDTGYRDSAYLSDAYAVKMEEARCRGWTQLNLQTRLVHVLALDDPHLVVPDADRGQVLEVDGDGAEGERCKRLSETKPGWETIGRPELGPAAAG
jgi:hypothetical protein